MDEKAIGIILTIFGAISSAVLFFFGLYKWISAQIGNARKDIGEEITALETELEEFKSKTNDILKKLEMDIALNGQNDKTQEAALKQLINQVGNVNETISSQLTDLTSKLNEFYLEFSVEREKAKRQNNESITKKHKG